MLVPLEKASSITETKGSYFFSLQGISIRPIRERGRGTTFLAKKRGRSRAFANNREGDGDLSLARERRVSRDGKAAGWRRRRKRKEGALS